MVHRRSEPALERIARAETSPGSGISVFAEPETGHVTTRHAHPVWKVALSPGAQIVVDGVPLGSGALVPPEHWHSCTATGAYLAVFLSPTRLPRRDTLPAGPVALDPQQVIRLVEQAQAVSFDDEAFLGHLGHRLRPNGPLLLAEHIAATDTLTAAARAVGVSSSRLRALAHRELGVALSRLRQWARLRQAVAGLQRDGRTISAAAADAGYADHAHLTRSARLQLGRAPGSLLPTGAPVAPQHRRLPVGRPR